MGIAQGSENLGNLREGDDRYLSFNRHYVKVSAITTIYGTT